MAEDLRPYVFRAVRNAALDDRRSTKRRSDSIFADVLAELSAASAHSSPGAKADLGELLGRLSADEREVVVLRIYSGLTFREIAELRQVLLPTAASWYRRGLERLGSWLSGDSR